MRGVGLIMEGFKMKMFLACASAFISILYVVLCIHNVETGNLFQAWLNGFAAIVWAIAAVIWFDNRKRFGP